MTPETWNLQLVIRAFSMIPLEGEFRGFVFQKQLNAVTQYYTDCYFEPLANQAKDIGDRIQVEAL